MELSPFVTGETKPTASQHLPRILIPAKGLSPRIPHFFCGRWVLCADIPLQSARPEPCLFVRTFSRVRRYAMHRHITFVFGLLIAALALLPAVLQSGAEPRARTIEMAQLEHSPQSRTHSTLQRRQLMPHQIPGITTPQATTPGAAFAQHCNGTCACTGSDCSRDWVDTNCKDGTATCTSTPDNRDSLVCSCIKKVAQ